MAYKELLLKNLHKPCQAVIFSGLQPGGCGEKRIV